MSLYMKNQLTNYFLSGPIYVTPSGLEHASLLLLFPQSVLCATTSGYKRQRLEGFPNILSRENNV